MRAHGNDAKCKAEPWQVPSCCMYRCKAGHLGYPLLSLVCAKLDDGVDLDGYKLVIIRKAVWSCKVCPAVGADSVFCSKLGYVGWCSGAKRENSLSRIICSAVEDWNLANAVWVINHDRATRKFRTLRQRQKNKKEREKRWPKTLA